MIQPRIVTPGACVGIVVTDRTATRSPATETIRAALRMAHSHDLSKRSVLLGLWQTAVSTILEAATSRADACRALVRHAQAIKGEGANADSPIMPMDTPTARRRVAEATEATKLIGACLDVYLENLTAEGRRDEFPTLIATSAFEILSDIWGPRHLRKAIAAQVNEIESGADSPILPDEPVTTNTPAAGLPAASRPAEAPEAARQVVPPAGTVPLPAPPEASPSSEDGPPPPMDGGEDADDGMPPPPPSMADEDEPAFEDEDFAVQAGEDAPPADGFEALDHEGEDALASLLALSDEGPEAAHAEPVPLIDDAPRRTGPDAAGHGSGTVGAGDEAGDRADGSDGEVDEIDLLGLLDIPEPPHVPALEDDLDDLPEPVARKPGDTFRPFMSTEQARHDEIGASGTLGDEVQVAPEPDGEAVGRHDDVPPPDTPDEAGSMDPHARVGTSGATHDDVPPLPDPSTAPPLDGDDLPEPLGETAPTVPTTRVALLETPVPAPASRAPSVPAPAAIPVPPSVPVPAAVPAPQPPARAGGTSDAEEPASPRGEGSGAAAVRQRLSASHRGRRLECCMLVEDDELGRDGIFAAVVTIRSADGLVAETRELSGRLGGITGRRAILHACRETLARLGEPAPGERMRFTVDSDLILQGARDAARRIGTLAEREVWDDIEALCAGRAIEWNRRRPGLGSGPGERCDRLIRATMGK